MPPVTPLHDQFVRLLPLTRGPDSGRLADAYAQSQCSPSPNHSAAHPLLPSNRLDSTAVPRLLTCTFEPRVRDSSTDIHIPNINNQEACKYRGLSRVRFQQPILRHTHDQPPIGDAQGTPSTTASISVVAAFAYVDRDASTQLLRRPLICNSFCLINLSIPSAGCHRIDACGGGGCMHIACASSLRWRGCVAGSANCAISIRARAAAAGQAGAAVVKSRLSILVR